jgi:hypothetical protein
MQAMTAVSWNAAVRGDVTLIRRMNDNFYAKDEQGVRFCVYPTSKIDAYKNCPKIGKLFELAFQEPKLFDGFVLRVEATKVARRDDLDWMASVCRYELQPDFVQKEIDNILDSAAKSSSEIVHQPQLDDQILTSIDRNLKIILDDVEFSVADVEHVNSKISIQNPFMSKILRAVAAEHNVHISQVAAACVMYCICNESILFRMQFNNQQKGQVK